MSASRSQYSDLKDDFDVLADKYNYTVTSLYYHKTLSSNIETLLSSLSRSLYIYIYIFLFIRERTKADECETLIETKLYNIIIISNLTTNYRETCEESVSQIKENIAGSVQDTTTAQSAYKGLVVQIDYWIDNNLLQKPAPNDTLKDLEFTPTNYVQM